MENIDLVQINFKPDQLFLLNICLGFLMFGVALDISIKDFKLILQKPKAPIIGLISQLLLMPLLTILLIKILQPPPSIVMGMILVAVCPGGNVSNYASHLAKANAALSVTLTSIVTIFAIIYTPGSFKLWTNLMPETESLRQVIQVPPFQMIKTILLLIALPLFIGIFINSRFPTLADKIREPVKKLSLIIFFSFVIVAMASNFDNLRDHVGKVFFIVLIHNTLGFIMGYYFAKWNGLDENDTRAISIETGIQNSGLALILIFNFFDGLGGMAMIAAWWGIWHLISGFAIAKYWASRPSSTF